MIALYIRKCLFNLKWKTIFTYFNLCQILIAICEPYKECSFCLGNLWFFYKINSSRNPKKDQENETNQPKNPHNTHTKNTPTKKKNKQPKPKKSPTPNSCLHFALKYPKKQIWQDLQMFLLNRCLKWWVDVNEVEGLVQRTFWFPRYSCLSWHNHKDSTKATAWTSLTRYKW